METYNVNGDTLVAPNKQAPLPSLSAGSVNTGLRYNTGKLRYDLLPPDAIEELVKVYTMGSLKYAARNWEKGLSYMDTVACLKRHLAKFEMNEDKDAESKLHHTAHVVWNALALLTFQLRGIGNDDRPKITVQQ
jgi:hypothetical protein